MKAAAPLPSGKRRSPSKAQPIDAERMRELAAFTARTKETPYPTAFGSEVIETATGRRVARRVNHSAQHKDPTQHAEVYALRTASKKVGTGAFLSLRGYTLYTTCEPCPMCMGACLWAGVDRVVYGATIDDAAQFYPQIYVYAKDLARRGDLACEVVGPVEREACFPLFTMVASKARRTPPQRKRQ